MRTRTKVSILLTVLFVATLGVTGGIVGMGLVAQSAKLIMFDTALVSGLVATGATVFGATNVVTGAVKRRQAEKIQAKSIARMVDNYQGNVKSKENVYKLSRDFTGALAYSAENNQSGMIGRRGVIGETTQQTIQRNKVDAFTARRNFFNAVEKGGVRQSKYYDKKTIKATTKLDQLNSTMGPIDRRYTYTAEVPDPFNGQIYYDHRNEIMCTSSETREKFKKLILSDPLRTSKKYYADFGYATTLQFANNETLKDICVKSNVEPHMEKYELLLLEEVKSEIKKSGKTEGIFPIRLKREHYTAHNKSTSTMTVILTEEDLNARIENITNYLKNADNIIVKGKNYLNRTYQTVQAEHADTDDLVQQ